MLKYLTCIRHSVPASRSGRIPIKVDLIIVDTHYLNHLHDSSTYFRFTGSQVGPSRDLWQQQYLSWRKILAYPKARLCIDLLASLAVEIGAANRPWCRRQVQEYPPRLSGRAIISD